MNARLIKALLFAPLMSAPCSAAYTLGVMGFASGYFEPESALWWANFWETFTGVATTVLVVCYLASLLVLLPFALILRRIGYLLVWPFAVLGLLIGPVAYLGTPAVIIAVGGSFYGVFVSCTFGWIFRGPKP